MPDREKVIKALRICVPETQDDLKLECSDCPYEDVCNPNDIGITLPLILDIRALLKEQDAVVRCKDCKYGYMTKNGAGEDAVECSNHYVSLDSICRQPDWFCADGERRIEHEK